MEKQFDAIKKEVEDMLQISKDVPNNYWEVEECYWKTISIVKSVYSENSLQYSQLDKIKGGLNREDWEEYSFAIMSMCNGILMALQFEIKNDLLHSLTQQISGEIYSGLIGLAKKASGNNDKIIAGTLAAAALEDSLKRYAELQMITVDDKTMAEVVNALKGKGFIKKTQSRMFETCVDLRNKIFHADWEKVELPEVKGMIAFTEAFIVEKF